MARNDEEFQMFQKMDEEREKQLDLEWKRAGKKGKRPPRLVQTEELPAWMFKEIRAENEDLESLGRGQRTKSNVDYDDTMSPNQFARVKYDN